MKATLGTVLGIVTIAAGVVVAVWRNETVAYVGAAVLVTAGIALVALPFLRRTQDGSSGGG
jgi:uncharacterized membrane protein YkgB